jgi:hypothetical protein
MSSSYQRGWTKLEISFSQLLTMLNMVSDEHIDETTALSMLTGLGVATPLSLVPPPPQTPSVNVPEPWDTSLGLPSGRRGLFEGGGSPPHSQPFFRVR